MSVEIRAKIICNQCGAEIHGWLQTSTSQGQESYWSACREAKRRHWMFLHRYGKTKHLCDKCSDGKPSKMVMPPVMAPKY